MIKINKLTLVLVMLLVPAVYSLVLFQRSEIFGACNLVIM